MQTRGDSHRSHGDDKELLRLASFDADAVLVGDSDYPARLGALKSPPPVLMFAGNRSLLDTAMVGVCGARSATTQGLEAANRLGRSLAENGYTVVAGNALGIDAEVQGAALATGGKTIMVLPEGLLHFRPRLGTNASDADETTDRVLVLSQFPATQPWTVGGAMARNGLIAGLAIALVVIEANAQGGTLAAGEAALKIGRPVFAIQFAEATPPGNALLIEKGATSIRTSADLLAALDKLPAEDTEWPGQLSLTLSEP